MHIVCIHAHPDDAEILAGGTLAILSELGQQITIVTMTAGDCGSSTLAPCEISAIRMAEAAASAALIGAAYRCAGFQDLSIFNDDPSRRRVTSLLRDLRPDIVLTAAPSDYLCDHETTSQLVRDACFTASVPNYSVPELHAPLPAIPHLYFLDPIAQMDRTGQVVVPDFTIDVASSLEKKRAMLSEHRSQRSWLNAQHGLADYLTQMENWTRAAGHRAGIAFGEGFRQYRTHPFPEEPLLQRILSMYIRENKEATFT
ncbi:MAG TPA: PIG-L family deacetylase [Bryobacteraceae bacterium]|jgi:LmbE family N-acetylglucosaminyl deacetylase